MTSNLGPCRMCGQPATTIRTETKTLSGYNKVQAVATVEVPVCARHAPRAIDAPPPIDARAMAEAFARGGTPPPPPSARYEAQGARDGEPDAAAADAGYVYEPARIAPPDPATPTPVGPLPPIEAIALDDRPSRDLAAVWTLILGACFEASKIEIAEVEAILAEYDRTDALMPVLDPTGYKAMQANIAGHRKVARAFRDLLAAMAEQGA